MLGIGLSVRTNAAHPMAVDHHAPVKIQAVVVLVIDVAGLHPPFEFLLTDDLADILQDERASADQPPSHDAPALRQKR